MAKCYKREIGIRYATILENFDNNGIGRKEIK